YHVETIASGGGAIRLRQAAVVASGVVFGAGLIADAWGSTPPAALLFAISFAIALPVTARRAWHAVRVGSLDINVLMIIAASGAIAVGQLSEAAAVVILFAVAQTLEARTLDRAR